jgi:hypothetical protein
LGDQSNLGSKKKRASSEESYIDSQESRKSKKKIEIALQRKMTKKEKLDMVRIQVRKMTKIQIGQARGDVCKHCGRDGSEMADRNS